MIYLLDTSGLVRMLSDTTLQTAWYDTICAGAVGSRHPQRAEFLFGARPGGEYDEIVEMFTDLYPDVPVPILGRLSARRRRLRPERQAAVVRARAPPGAGPCGLNVRLAEVSLVAVIVWCRQEGAPVCWPCTG
ncbi:VapC toxin family PIN domain ribonuclease [Streptomyces sp. NPDC006175]|uniref:VapC toxin family PIN domain ribonuclease n=1 Tax=Streptomyces sp. NPDC006175 TaxID=3154471 RepID=UPI0033A2EF01